VISMILRVRLLEKIVKLSKKHARKRDDNDIRDEITSLVTIYHNTLIDSNDIFIDRDLIKRRKTLDELEAYKKQIESGIHQT